MSEAVLYGLGPSRPQGDDTLAWQGFIVEGRRLLMRREIEEGLPLAVINATSKALNDTLELWLTLWPVLRWRAPPETDIDRDYATDNVLVTVRGRGWLEIPVRLGDHTTWLVELPT